MMMTMNLSFHRWLLLILAISQLCGIVMADLKEEGTCLVDGTCSNTDNSSEKTTSNPAASTQETKDRTLEDNLLKCIDNHENCDFWASLGECSNNAPYMRKNCMKSCRLCSDEKYVTYIYCGKGTTTTLFL